MTAAVRKRPWYVVLALLGALTLGLTGAYGGWATISLYREPVDLSRASEGIGDPADRAAVDARTHAFLDTLDAQRSRGWPLAVASLVLGVAMVVATSRTLARGSGARSALVQIVIVQAAANVCGFFLLRDVIDAEVRVVEAQKIAELRATDAAHADEAIRWVSRVVRFAPGIQLVLHSLASALVVAGLTRRRARDLLDGEPEAAPEP